MWHFFNKNHKNVCSKIRNANVWPPPSNLSTAKCCVTVRKSIIREHDVALHSFWKSLITTRWKPVSSWESWIGMLFRSVWRLITNKTAQAALSTEFQLQTFELFRVVRSLHGETRQGRPETKISPNGLTPWRKAGEPHGKRDSWIESRFPANESSTRVSSGRKSRRSWKMMISTNRNELFTIMICYVWTSCHIIISLMHLIRIRSQTRCSWILNTVTGCCWWVTLSHLGVLSGYPVYIKNEPF